MNKYWWQIHCCLCLYGEDRADKTKAPLDLLPWLMCSVSVEITWVTATMQVTILVLFIIMRENMLYQKNSMSTLCRKAAGEAFAVELLALVTICRSVCWSCNPNIPLSFRVAGYHFAAPKDEFGMQCLLSAAQALQDVLCIFSLMSRIFFFFLFW